MYLQQTGTNAIIADSTGIAPLNDTTANLQTHPAFITGSFTVVSALPTPYFLLNFASPIQTPQIITPPSLTKGTQGTVGMTIQELKDAGRTFISLYATGVASGATGVETLITLTRYKQGITSGTSFIPTSGKYFRVTAISFAARGHATATAQVTTFSIRVNTAGAIATGSPAVLPRRVATPATALAWDRIDMSIPDGIEFLGDGTLQFGVSANAVFVTNAPTWDVMILGFEY